MKVDTHGENQKNTKLNSDFVLEPSTWQGLIARMY